MVCLAPKLTVRADMPDWQFSAMCGRLRVGKENLYVAGLDRCSHVFGLLARFA